MKKIFFLSLLSFVFLLINAQQVPSADAVLKAAYAKAAKENKNVMVIFHASWCGWCHKMDTSLNDPSVKDFFTKNYVIEHLTVYESKGKENLENPGALQLLTKYHGNDQGIPFWLVLDKNGDLLGDSEIGPGKNCGCPATEEEVQHFIGVLKKSSSITSEQIAAVEKRFRRNQ